MEGAFRPLSLLGNTSRVYITGWGPARSRASAFSSNVGINSLIVYPCHSWASKGQSKATLLYTLTHSRNCHSNHTVGSICMFPCLSCRFPHFSLCALFFLWLSWHFVLGTTLWTDTKMNPQLLVSPIIFGPWNKMLSVLMWLFIS